MKKRIRLAKLPTSEAKTAYELLAEAEKARRAKRTQWIEELIISFEDAQRPIKRLTSRRRRA